MKLYNDGVALANSSKRRASDRGASAAQCASKLAAKSALHVKGHKSVQVKCVTSDNTRGGPGLTCRCYVRQASETQAMATSALNPPSHGFATVNGNACARAWKLSYGLTALLRGGRRMRLFCLACVSRQVLLPSLVLEALCAHTSARPRITLAKVGISNAFLVIALSPHFIAIGRHNVGARDVPRAALGERLQLR